MTSAQIDPYQTCLEHVFDAIGVEKKTGSQTPFTEAEGEEIMRIYTEYAPQFGFSFLYFQTLLETYTDADPMIRQLHRGCWVRKITKFGLDPNETIFDDDFYPPVALTMKSVRQRFFET